MKTETFCPTLPKYKVTYLEMVTNQTCYTVVSADSVTAACMKARAEVYAPDIINVELIEDGKPSHPWRQ